MMVLDTDHLTLLEWSLGKEAQQLRARLEQVPVEQRATTIVTYEEQTHGWLAYMARARTLAQQIDAYRKLQRLLHREERRSLREIRGGALQSRGR